jgi:anti-sigma factor RsiW
VEFDKHRDERVDWVLLARHFAGELSPSEQSRIEQWLESDPARRQEVAELRRVWEDAGMLPTSSRIDALWDALAAKIRAL